MTIAVRVLRSKVCFLAVLLLILQTWVIFQLNVHIHLMEKEGSLENITKLNTDAEQVPRLHTLLGNGSITELPLHYHHHHHHPYTASADVQAERLKLVSHTCERHGRHIPGVVDRVFVYEARGVAYCSTHKIASTFWTRVYRWLYNDTRPGQAVRSPLDISKRDTHLMPLRKLKVRHVSESAQDAALVNGSYRFLFTREPFARLWSVYIDKFLLPDNYFWSSFSSAIKKVAREADLLKPAGSNEGKLFAAQPAPAPPKAMNTTQRVDMGPQRQPAGSTTLQNDAASQRTPGSNKALPPHPPALPPGPAQDTPNQKQAAAVPPNPRDHKTSRTRCLDVSFGEFLQFIVHVASRRSGAVLDDHFRPVHYGCNPCLFQPDLIGKIESMKNDSEAVLRRMGLDSLLQELGASHHVEQEMDMLIDFNFQLVVKMKLQRRCVSPKDLERRLIRAFVYNGYLTEEDESSLLPVIPLGESRLKEVVQNLYRNSGRTSADVRQQRKKYKVQAYRELPKPLLTSLQKVFHWDFVLFGYDPFPSDIFGT